MAGKEQISLNTSIIFHDSFVRERNGYGDVIESVQLVRVRVVFEKSSTETGRVRVEFEKLVRKRNGDVMVFKI